MDAAEPVEVPGPPRDEQLLAGLAKLGQAVRMSAWRNAGPYGLSPLQADILAFLAGDDRPRRQGEVVAALASTAPTVSDAMRALTGKGLVSKARDAVDARASVLTLTDIGRQEAARLSAVPEPLRAAVAALDPDDLAAMLRGASAMMRVLQERRAIPISRMCLTCRFYRPDAHPDDPARPHHCMFVDAPFGDGELRLDCPDHEPA
ncbi:MarR family winged helix-turn-helix transcriptional regulator [Planobispora siamensis]|uniref:MarR family transcriptional regulator n=1 Tax=Planobispora siamensis TaxID=936338 RepID=A0A8J3SAW3_9ACTN|nr:MarR family winged helix-turn-helix transcriptional regulator [Planobispora siamensis]GIH89865.1 MarR family transcriptional regulator [Planobispora siamensis]